MVGIRTGEAVQGAVVQANNRDDAILSGFAHRCVAASLVEDGEETTGKIGLTINSVPTRSPERRQRRKHDEQMQYAMENNKDVAAVFIEYHIAAVPLEKLLGCKLPYTSKSTSHDGAASTALNKLAQRDRVQHEKAQAAWKSLQRIREAVSVEKQKADLKWYKQRDNERTRASAGTSSAPITRDAMEQAKAQLSDRRPAAPDLSRYYEASRIEQDDNRKASTSLLRASGSASAGDIPACSLTTGIHPSVVEQMEQMIEDDREMEQAQHDIFDQGWVVEGRTVPVEEEGSEEQDGRPALVRTAQPTSSFPSAKAMAHELGGN
ncbi:uncharacterized protein SRS1_11574 [Sporisorium reilianum f. sp. reilianum]|uniref:Uncharacterized protein n=1 Tax=Sporisorium reilianum f. sp. reilianum TaxID=72559 RepID=A0A2N8U6D9_9BASI|nr:uncharacterized protein SRS1_11574 [Sporisorium reilianum f. sp. reilianum]